MNVREIVETHGFAILPEVLSLDMLGRAVHAAGPVDGAGKRGILLVPEVLEIATLPVVLELIRPLLRDEPIPVRAILFDKSASSNWLVPWHQDLTLAVRERLEVPGFGPWSEKEGTPHVQAPVKFLEQMITARLHLDAADETNGALRVLAGTHKMGRLDAVRIRGVQSTHRECLCAVSAGGALVMRPLLLHSSGKSVGSGSRRVLHVEYAASSLPGGLHWAERG